jgi:hypothetical protein
MGWVCTDYVGFLSTSFQEPAELARDEGHDVQQVQIEQWLICHLHFWTLMGWSAHCWGHLARLELKDVHQVLLP